MATKQTHVEVTGNTSKYERAMREARLINEKTTNAMKKAWRGVGAVVAGIYSVSKVKNMMFDWAQAAGVQQKAVAGFHQALVSMGRYTPEFEKQMIGVAQSIQKTTTMGDEAAIAGMKFLATYKDIGNDVMPRVARTMADLAALMGGDAKQAANMLGKASMGMAGELRRVGITIDKDIAKSGDFLAILKQIEQQVGGQAKALAETGLGPWEQLGNLMGDAKEAMGEFVLAGTKHLLPFLTDWAEGVKIIAHWMTKLTEGMSSMDILNAQLSKYQSQLKVLREKAEKSSGWVISLMYGSREKLDALIREKEMQIANVQATIRRELSQKKEEKPSAVIGGSIIVPGKDVTDKDILRQAQIYESLKDMYNVHEQRMLSDKSEYMQRHREIEAAQIAGIHSMKLGAEYDHESRMLALKEGTMTAEMELAHKTAQEVIKTEQLKQKAKQESTKRSLDYAVWAFQQLGQYNEIAFRMYQGVAIGEAVMSTHAAVVRALAEVPWPFNWIEAGTRAAYGAMQVAAIASQSPTGGGGVVSAGGAVPTYPASPATGLPVSTTGQESKGAVTINIEGDFIGDEAFIDRLVEKINEAGDREVFVN